LKYEYGKLNPAKSDIVYTLGAANIHENTNFRFFTTPGTKIELMALQEEARQNKPKEEIEEEKEEKKEGEGDADVAQPD
jgi:hypothetical protein